MAGVIFGIFVIGLDIGIIIIVILDVYAKAKIQEEELKKIYKKKHKDNKDDN